MTAEQIKSLRERLGLSTMALANKIGVSVDTIRSYEQGRRTPVDRIARLLSDLEASTTASAEGTR